MPITAFIGVRISWLMVARNSVLAQPAAGFLAGFVGRGALGQRLVAGGLQLRDRRDVFVEGVCSVPMVRIVPSQHQRQQKRQAGQHDKAAQACMGASRPTATTPSATRIGVTIPKNTASGQHAGRHGDRHQGATCRPKNSIADAAVQRQECGGRGEPADARRAERHQLLEPRGFVRAGRDGDPALQEARLDQVDRAVGDEGHDRRHRMTQQHQAERGEGVEGGVEQERLRQAMQRELVHAHRRPDRLRGRDRPRSPDPHSHPTEAVRLRAKGKTSENLFSETRWRAPRLVASKSASKPSVRPSARPGSLGQDLAREDPGKRRLALQPGVIRAGGGERLAAQHRAADHIAGQLRIAAWRRRGSARRRWPESSPWPAPAP